MNRKNCSSMLAHVILTLLALVYVGMPVNSQAASGCDIPVWIDCVSVTTNVTKRGYQPLIQDNQNPKIYLRRQTTYSGYERRDGVLSCYNCHHYSTINTSETWEFNSVCALIPTNSAFSGEVTSYSEVSDNTNSCVSTRLSLTEWSNPTCLFNGTSATNGNAPLITADSFSRTLTNSFIYYNWSHPNRHETNWQTVTITTNLYLPYSLDDVYGSLSSGLMNAAFPDWSNATRYAVAERGGIAPFAPVGEYMDFNPRLGKFKYRIRFLGPRDFKEIIKCYEVFTPYGGGPVTNAIFTNQVVCTGDAQFFLFPDGTSERVVPPPPIAGKTEVFLDNTSGCGSQTCNYPGTCEASSGSVEAKFGLGKNNYGEPAGFIYIHETNGNITASSSSLKLFLNHGVFALSNAGSLYQVKAPQTLVVITNVSASKCQISFYGGTSGMINGFYIPSGSPTTWFIENPGGTRNLYISKDSTIIHNFAWSFSDNGWALTAAGLKQEIRGTTITNGFRTETYTVKETNGTVVYKEVKVWQQHPALGDLLVTNKVGSDSAPLVTYWTYYTNPSDVSNYGQIQKVVRPGGAWTKYEYTNGRIAKVVSCFGNNDESTLETTNRVTLYSYNSEATGIDNGLNDTNTPRKVIEKVQDHEISRLYRVLSPGQIMEIKCQTPGAAINAADNLTNITQTFAIAGFDGTIQSEFAPDGTVQITKTPIPREGVWLTNIVLSGQPDGTGIGILDGIQTTTIINGNGQTVSTETIAVPSYITLSRQQYGYSSIFGSPTVITNLDNSVTYKTYAFDCCGLDTTSDMDGVTTTFYYDPLYRIIGTGRLSVKITNGLDAAGNIKSYQKIGSNGHTITARTYAFDWAGQQTNSVDALSNSTATLTYFLNSGRSNCTVYPDTGTRIEVYAGDGSLVNVSGTRVYPARYEYGVEQDNSVWRCFVKEIKLNSSGNDTLQWAKFYLDSFGRIYKKVYPNAMELSVYNNKGQLAITVDADGVTNRYGYNSKGEWEYTTNGPDRVVHMVNSVLYNSENYPVQHMELFELNDLGAWISVAFDEISNDLLRMWQVRSGVTNRSQTAYGANGIRTVTSTSSDGTQSIKVFQNGLLTSYQISHPQDGIVKSETYGYDEYGRQNTITDARNGTTILIYNNADLVVTNVTPPPTPTQAAQKTYYSYDKMGRIQITTFPDNTTATNLYYLTGDLKYVGGSRTYSAAFAYDSQGRITYMTNWQANGAVTTMWNYDPQRGFLVSKKYATTNGPVYTYTEAGRLKSQVWQRGITNSYGYNGYGDLQSVTYSDGTPTLTNGYDRRGRISAIGQGTNRVSILLNDAGQLLSESGNGIVLSNMYDALLRPTSIQLRVANTNAFLHSLGYDKMSRLQGITNGTFSASYSFVPQSSLIQETTFKHIGTQKLLSRRAYDSLNRLREQASALAGGYTFIYDYDYNLANQRTNVTLADGSHWSYVYDVYGQLTDATKSWSDGKIVMGQQFKYRFDTLGNRTASWSGGDGNLLTMHGSRYVVNSLNQYTSRNATNYGSLNATSIVDIVGAANSAAIVYINNQAVTNRHGDYWWQAIKVTNDFSSTYLSLTNRSDYNGTYLTNIGNLFVPQKSEPIIHDADGNLIQDGRWSLTWNGENRLVGFISLTNTPSSSWFSGYFTYDYLGRRTSKVVSNWTGTAWAKLYDYRYVYDKWNLVAILDGQTNLLYSFVWGTDLSGSRYAAGGVGGLISMTVHNGSNAGTYFYCFDGSGNVVGLVNSADGSAAAVYEYAPAGELIRATGPIAFINPFRFSTKFQDDETGYYYFIGRFYSPSFGKWLSKDPIQERGWVNLYGFCFNNSQSYYDRNGLQIFIATPVEAVVRVSGEFGRVGYENFRLPPEYYGPLNNQPVGRPVGMPLEPPLPLTPSPLSNPNGQPVPDPSGQQVNAPKPIPTIDQQAEPYPAYLYRAMTIDRIDNYPLVGESARTLGVRPNIDVEITIWGTVKPQNSKGDYQGMSVAPFKPNNLFWIRRPKELVGPIPGQPDGPGQGKDPVWEIPVNALGAFIEYHQDSPTHGVIYPKFCMDYESYKKDLEWTRWSWNLADLKPFIVNQ